MKLHRVRPAFAVVVFAAALAACGGGGGGAVPGSGGGGGGGGGGSTPTPTATPVATNTPNASGYVAPSGGVTQLGPGAANVFSSSLLAASTDGTFVVQSTDTPAEPASGSSLTEYDVTASESAAGQKPSATARGTFAHALHSTAPVRADGRVQLVMRPRLDPRSSGLFQQRLRTALARGSRERGASSVRRLSFVQGNQRTFHVLQGTITGTGGSCTPPQQSAGGECYVDVPATLQAVSNHAYVWVDNSIDATYNFTAADWTQTAGMFDTAYARETSAFGPAFLTENFHYNQCDTTGKSLQQSSFAPTVDLSGADPHISILITRALENSGEGGYFDFRNDVNDQELNCATSAPHAPSNQLPMFVLAVDKYATTSGTITDENFWRTFDMPRTLPHEFQHYLHALDKVLIPELGNNTQAYFDDSVVDEGDSELAEDLVLGNAANPPQAWESRLNSFLYLFDPGNFSLPSFTGYDANPLDTSTTPAYGFYHSTAGSYGGAYLFARYLYDRFGGDAALHRLYADNSPTPANGANLHPLVAEAGNGETFSQLYADFAAALAARNVASADPRFTFGSNVLLRGQTTFTLPGSQVINAVFNGPRSPEDLTSSTPETLGRIKLTPTSTVHAKLITGATLFFNAAQSAGSTVGLTATSAAPGTVDGALVQGAYDDGASCIGPPSGCP